MSTRQTALEIVKPHGPDVGKMADGTLYGLWVYSRDEGWTQMAATSKLGWPALSPDARWLAYGSNELGDNSEVAVRPFPGKGATVRVSRYGGTEPVWSRDGSELFYRGPDEDGARWIWAVPVSASGERIEVGSPVKLFKDIYQGADPIRYWDVLSDGRFVLLKPMDDEVQGQGVHEMMPRRIQIVQNWASSLD